MTFHVLQHGWYMQSNSVAAMFNMLETRRSCGNMLLDENYHPPKIILEDSVLIIKSLVVVSFE